MRVYEAYCLRRDAIAVTPTWAIFGDYTVIMTEEFVASPFAFTFHAKEAFQRVQYMNLAMLLHNHDVLRCI